MGNMTVPKEYHIPSEIVTRSTGRGAFLGKGGYGRVLRGEMRIGACVIPVAIKCLLVSSEPTLRGVVSMREVEREVMNMASVHHDNILKIYGGFYKEKRDPTTKQANIVLEYCAGGSLGMWLQRECVVNSITARDRIHVMLQVAEGLHYLHNLDVPIAHRDLSRDNVLATTVSLDAVMKICDFGLARHVHSSVSRATVGKFPYMPPTFYLPDRRVDDIYSLGILLWEIWTGKKAYARQLSSGFNRLDLYDSVRRGLRPCTPENEEQEEDFGSDIPETLRALVCRCWDQDPLIRPSIDEVTPTLELLVDPSREAEDLFRLERDALELEVASLRRSNEELASQIENQNGLIAILGGQVEEVSQKWIQLDEENSELKKSLSQSSPGLPSLPTVPNTWGVDRMRYDWTSIRDVSEPLAGGAFGFVRSTNWRGMEIVVKEIRIESAAPGSMCHFRKMAMNEVYTTLILQHPNVIRVFGYTIGTVQTQPPQDVVRIMMESMDGSLWSAVNGVMDDDNSNNWKKYRARDLNLADKYELIYQAAKALAFLHERRIMHRDVKGRNFLVSNLRREVDQDRCIEYPNKPRYVTEETVVKICDLSLAVRIDTSLGNATGVSGPRGTPFWMAPEVILSTDASDPKWFYSFPADMYSFSMMMFELLYGRYPFNSIHETNPHIYNIELKWEGRNPCRVNTETLRDAVATQNLRPSLHLLELYSMDLAFLIEDLWAREEDEHGRPIIRPVNAAFKTMSDVVEWMDVNREDILHRCGLVKFHDGLSCNGQELCDHQKKIVEINSAHLRRGEVRPDSSELEEMLSTLGQGGLTAMIFATEQAGDFDFDSALM